MSAGRGEGGGPGGGEAGPGRAAPAGRCDEGQRGHWAAPKYSSSHYLPTARPLHARHLPAASHQLHAHPPPACPLSALQAVCDAAAAWHLTGPPAVGAGGMHHHIHSRACGCGRACFAARAPPSAPPCVRRAALRAVQLAATSQACPAPPTACAALGAPSRPALTHSHQRGGPAPTTAALPQAPSWLLSLSTAPLSAAAGYWPLATPQSAPSAPRWPATRSRRESGGARSSTSKTQPGRARRCWASCL